MLTRRRARRAIPVALATMLLTTAPGAAFQPSQPIFQGEDPPVVLKALASRGAGVVAAVEEGSGDDRRIFLRYSPDGGTTWPLDEIFVEPTGGPVFHASAFVCDGMALVPYIMQPTSAPDERHVRMIRANLDGSIFGEGAVIDSGHASRPVGACLPGSEMALAYFRKTSSGWKARLITRRTGAGASSDQSIDLGAGTPSKGIAIVSTSSRVYVAWFRGNALRVQRFKIGSTASHTLSSLGTQVVLTSSTASLPAIGADGSRVVLAYMHQADLRVRRSTNSGATFGSATTLRNEPFPSEIGAFPISVAVKGSLVAIGGVELGGIETPTGKGLGYRSTNGGASYTLLATHAVGRTGATIVKVGSSYKYAEAWDQSISEGTEVRFRRK